MHNKKIFYVLGVIAFVVLVHFLFISPPSDFRVGSIIKVEQGKSLRGVSLLLKEQHLIRSRTAFEAFVLLFNKDGRVVATDYYFDSKLPVYELARRISKGEHHIEQIKITIPEGLSNTELSVIFASKLPYFNKEKFLLDASGKDGSLFPDTYYFFVTDTEADVVKFMSENFDKKITILENGILSSNRSEKEIIIMASILEKEAKGDADRSLISGILWKRLSIGMALQVDAEPDTYKIKGLPKNPISNPGMKAIQAAITPQSSPYLYYLHDKEGNTYYSRNFEEHKRNIDRYLK